MNNGDLVGLRRLVLTEFRNHTRLELDLNSKAIVLYGANGAGKTNILEAISTLAPGRGIRGAELGELSRQSDYNGSFAVAAIIGEGELERKIGVGLDINSPTNRKITRIDGKDVSNKQTLETLRLIWVTPQMDRIFAGPHSERRKFLDRIIVSFHPEISSQMSVYEKTIKERQKILDSDFKDPVWLDGLEIQAAQAGVAIAMARIESLSILQNEINDNQTSNFPKAKLSLDGFIENAIISGQSPIEAEEKFKAELKNTRAKDSIIGRASIGPHKTEISAIHADNGMIAEKCSTGEQKALLFGLILAQARAISGTIAKNSNLYLRPVPILLLDEAGAHFDKKRRDALAQELLELNGQSWLTGTDKNLFEGFENDAEYYAISQNQAIKI